MKTANLYQELIYNEEKPMITVLFETDFTKEIRIAMKKGTIMREHKTAFPIVVQLLEGNIDFSVQKVPNQLKKGDLIALDGNVPHDLKAHEDSVIRLTLTKYDNTQRVEKVVEK